MKQNDMLDFYQKHKEKIEMELRDLEEGKMNAGVGTVGDYNNRIKILEKQRIEINEKIGEEAKSKIFNNTLPEQDVKLFRLFLASSSELKAERDQFEIFINRENNRLIGEKKFLRLIVWEDFIDAMSKTRLQDEYNKAIETCDVFVSLYNTKTGKFTEEEFNKALVHFKQNGKPLVYTYFKDTATDANNVTPEAESLLKFKNKLKELGHFYTTFNNIHDLKYQFKMQLEKILPTLK